MGQTAGELRADIEQRRERMSGTVDAIEDRVMPGRIIGRRKNAARNWMDRTRGRVMGTPHRMAAHLPSPEIADKASSGAHQVAETISSAPEQLVAQTRGAPLIAGGIAFGVGAMLALVLPESEAEIHLGEQVQPQVEAVTDAAKDAAQQTLAATKESAQESVGELTETAAEHAQEMRDTAKSAGQDVAETAKQSTSS